jgi:hypothetical protein
MTPRSESRGPPQLTTMLIKLEPGISGHRSTFEIKVASMATCLCSAFKIVDKTMAQK